MNLLLDTHIFIWWTISPNRLSEKVSELIANPKNILFLSLVSIWEMQIKSQLGKLSFDLPLADLIKRQQEVNALYLLPIEVTHIYNLAKGKLLRLLFQLSYGAKLNRKGRLLIC